VSDHHAQRARVHDARDEMIQALRHTDERGNVCRLEPGHQIRYPLRVEAGVLHVDDHEIEIRGFQDLREPARAELHDHGAGGHPPLVHHTLESFLFHAPMLLACAYRRSFWRKPDRSITSRLTVDAGASPRYTVKIFSHASRLLFRTR